MSELLEQYSRRVMSTLWSKSKGPWRTEIERIFESSAEKQIGSVSKLLEKMNMDQDSPLIRVVEGSTNMIEDLLSEALPSQRNEVLKFLRNTQRVIQLGKGRGKALLLPQGNLMVLPQSFSSTTFTLANTADIFNYISVLSDDFKFLLEQNNKLKLKNAELESLVETLKEENSLRYRLSWS